MRLISTCFLCFVLTLFLFECSSSHKRVNEVDSGFGGTVIIVATGGVSGIDVPASGSVGIDSGYIAVGGSGLGPFDAAYVDAAAASGGSGGESGGSAGTGGASGIGVDDDSGIDGAPCAPNCPDLEWVAIAGGTFQMGSAETMGLDNQRPRHEVTVPTFQILKIEVTNSQYRRCFDAGVCNEPIVEASAMSMTDLGFENNPISGVDWYQASVFARWIGGRLPSEAEWEYAARSGGQDILYPWGNEEISCDRAVYGLSIELKICDGWGPMPVCSKPSGNTAQGLCDMSGNVYEWVEDDWHESYGNAPSDGQAWIDNPRGVERIARGGSYSFGNYYTSWREEYDANFAAFDIGFRVVLDPN